VVGHDGREGAGGHGGGLRKGRREGGKRREGEGGREGVIKRYEFFVILTDCPVSW